MRFFPFQKKKTTYLDYAGATPVHPRARTAMRAVEEVYANPGAIHEEAVQSSRVLERAREGVARELACKPREIVFTSGGTEANNLAILGLARQLAIKGMLAKTHWIVSSIEHPSVLECFSEIERLGGVVTHIDPEMHGLVTVDSVLSAVRSTTMLVSIGWANGEIGTVQPLREIAHALRAHPHVLLHTDAGQAPLYLAPQVHTLGVDMMTLDSGKLYGPRGVGALYLSNRLQLAPILFGGAQERGLRPGTENPILATGFAEALAAAGAERHVEERRLFSLRSLFLTKVLTIPGTLVNGEKRVLPNIVNISVPGIQSEYMTLSLAARGIAISTKSACREGNNRRSHVVESLGGEAWRAENTLRFSFGRETTEHDLMRTLEHLKEIVTRHRA